MTKVGKYTVTVTDECGNESVYEFEIIKAKKPVNVGLIIAFVVSMMVAVGAATFFIINKKREGNITGGQKQSRIANERANETALSLKFYLKCLTRA